VKQSTTHNDFVATENNKEQAGKNGASDRANETSFMKTEAPTGQMKIKSSSRSLRQGKTKINLGKKIPAGLSLQQGRS
jgi:hypothetical protein